MTDTYDQSHEEWWAGLSQEERFLAMETVRLDQDPDYPHPGRPTGERAEWIRRQPQYLERYTDADATAHKDDVGLGISSVPEAHEDTQPLD